MLGETPQRVGTARWPKFEVVLRAQTRRRTGVRERACQMARLEDAMAVRGTRFYETAHKTARK